MGPATIDDVNIRCERLREGSSVSHLERRILQEGKPRVVAIVSYGTRRPGSIDMPRMALPNWAGKPGMGIELPFMARLSPEFTQHLDHRWEAPYLPLGRTETPYVRGWLYSARPASFDAA